MLSSLSRKFSVLQTSSADNMARQQFRVFNVYQFFNVKHPPQALITTVELLPNHTENHNTKSPTQTAVEHSPTEAEHYSTEL